MTRFATRELLGEGTLGTVWTASDASGPETVALRRIHQWIAEDPRDRSRLAAELAANRALRHPGLLAHQDADLSGDSPWMSMELMEGGSLARRLVTPAGPRGLPTPEVLRMGSELLGVLAHLHDQGRQHGNLKPSNVLFRPDGRSVLADAGLAYWTRSHGLTLAGSVRDTLAAAAPEQLRGAPPHPGSDLFSLGLLLYEALDGKHPNRRRPLPVQLQPRDLCARLSGRPPALVDLVVRLLEPDPRKRPSDSRAIAKEMELVQQESEAATATVLPVRLESAKTPHLRRSWPMELEEVLRKLGLEVRGVLGRGAMGWVMDSWDPRLERRVAVKIAVASSEAQRNVLHRLLREARAGAELAHEALLPIYDAGWVGPHAYLTMPVVDGATLEQLLGISGPMTAREVRTIGLQLCGALAHLHARGLLHRDIKPSNVLMDGDGHVFLSDLGLVLSMDETRFTADGVFLGTPRYSAPEVLRGGGHSTLSDQYQLGATLHMLLEGRGPLPDEAIRDLVAGDSTGDPCSDLVEPAEDATLHERVAHAVRKACRFDAGGRHASVADLARSLQEAVPRRATSRHTDHRSSPRPALRPGSSRRRQAIALALFAGAPLALALVLMLRRDDSPMAVTSITTSTAPPPSSPDSGARTRADTARSRIEERLRRIENVQRVRRAGPMSSVFSELRELENHDEAAPHLLALVTEMGSWIEALDEVPVRGVAWHDHAQTVVYALDLLRPALRTTRGKDPLVPLLGSLERRLVSGSEDPHRRIFSLTTCSFLRLIRDGDTRARTDRVRDLALAIELFQSTSPDWRTSPTGRHRHLKLLDDALVAHAATLRTLATDNPSPPSDDPRVITWRLEMLRCAEEHDGAPPEPLAPDSPDWKTVELLMMARVIVHLSPLASSPSLPSDVRERTLRLARTWKPRLDVPLNADDRDLAAAWARMGM